MSRKTALSCLMLVIPFILTGCGQSSPSAIETAIAQTQESAPTETPIPSPTPIPAKDMFIDDVLFIPGDLPKEPSPGQIKNKLPEELIDLLPPPDKVVHQLPGPAVLEYFGVIVMLYDSLEDRDEAYEQLIYYSDTFEDSSTPRYINPLEDVGEKAFIAGFDPRSKGIGRYNPLVGFTRCHSVVYIEFYDFLTDTDGETTITYAQRLDSRLEKVVCQ